MRKIQFYKILFLICFWLFCAIFITFYDSAVLGFKSEIEGGHYSFLHNLLAVILTCAIGATLLGSLEVLYLSKLLRKKPFGITLLIKTVIYLMFMLFFISMVTLYMYSSEINKPMLSTDVLILYVDFLLSARIVMTFIYWGIACMSALFILQVSDKFGQGVLISFLLGKYHRPKEDDRIFMFMDLKSSTTYAEKLGHIKYSQFIQDCFFDITDVISKYDAKIYQYVGDEVVLSWSIKEGIEHGHCINTFFAYDSLLKSKKNYYQNKYGIIPEFKAGLHLGKVTVAEVGEIKKELAYHGDVLNTVARIQGKCNDFQKRLLISESMKTKLENQPHFEFSILGDVILKGKAKSLNLYAVNPV
ncbi:MAG: adenylate/guanylate cyclase domain-containing protein [Nitrospinales bacterium]